MMRTLARSSPRLRPAMARSVATGGNGTSRGSAGAGAGATALAAAAAAGLILASSAPGVEGYLSAPPAFVDSKNHAAFIDRFGTSTPKFRGSVALCQSSKPAAAADAASAPKSAIATSPSSSNKQSQFDPSSHDYYERVQLPDRSQTESHAIFGPLLGQGRIERYNFYRRVNVDKAKLQPNHSSAEGAEPIEVAVGDVQLGNKVNGHEGIVHGGIISLIFDDAMGWGYEALLMSDPELDADPARIVTANLNIDYRAPLMEDSRAVVRVNYVRSEGRKIFFQARLESHDGEILYAEATSLFVKLRKE